MAGMLAKPDVERHMSVLAGVPRSRPVTELELTRAPDDRRTYVLDGVGSLRLEGWVGRRATLDAGGRTWLVGRAGFWQRRGEGTHPPRGGGAPFAPRAVRRGGGAPVGGRAPGVGPPRGVKGGSPLPGGG